MMITGGDKMAGYVRLHMENRRMVTLCNHNYSLEGIFHPDRVMEEYDLLYMQSGEWDIWEEDQSFHLVPGSVLLLEPGKHHYSVDKCTPGMRNIYIHFVKASGDILTLQEKGEADKRGALFANAYLYIPKLVQTMDHQEIRHGFERVIDAFWSQKGNSAYICSLQFENLLTALADLGSEASGQADILVTEIIHRFHCEPERFLSPEELAQDYHVSVRTISGRFKAQTGISIHRYQLQLKLDMAYDLLPLSPGRSLHDIALSYGFYDEFQFSKRFKQRFGISPSERR